MTPFTCSSFAYLFTSSIYQLDLATGAGSTIATLTPANSINAVGFYVADGYMYGFDITTNQVAKIGKDGDIQDLFAVANLPVQGYNVGDIDDDGYYYFTVGASTIMYVVDLNPSRATTYGKLVDAATKAISTTGTTMTGSMGGAFIGTGDWAFNPIDGSLYYVKNSDGIVRKVNPSTGVITQLTTTGAINGVYGGIFFSPDGSMYATDSNSGSVYKYSISGTNATRSLFSTTGLGTIGDGARCRYAPIFFADIENPPVKSASPYKNVGETISYRIVLKNIGNITAENIKLIDTLPLGTIFITNTVNVNGISKNGDPNPPTGINIGSLNVGVSTITFLAIATSIPSPNPTPNNAVITYEFTDSTTSTVYNRSANTTTASTTIVDLTVVGVKSVDKITAGIGDTITYTVVLTSTGNVNTSNLTFIDTIPNGTQLISGTFTQDGANVSGNPNPPGATLPTQLTGNDVSTVTFKVLVVSIGNPNPINNMASLGYSYTSDPTTSTIRTQGIGTNTVETTLISSKIAFIKSVDKVYAKCGDTITYTFTMKNEGGSDGFGVKIIDTLPSSLLFINDSVSIDGVVQIGVDPLTGIDLGTITIGQIITVQFQAKINC